MSLPVPREKPRSLTPNQVETSITGPVLNSPKKITHFSFSGRKKFEDCPKAYQLTYIMGAPQRGSVWFVGGIAVHAMTEAWDRWMVQHEGEPANLPRPPFDPQAEWKKAFGETLEREKAKDPDFAHWRKAGTKAGNPEGESLAYWYSHLGPELVKAYMAWRRRAPWKIWTTPEGEPAIELDVGGSLPGMGTYEYKGFIDRVFIDEMTNELSIVDLKTGSRKPENALQFGTYGAAMKAKYGIDVKRGTAFMNRRGSLSEPHDLTMYTPEYVGEHFAQTARAVEAGYFVPKVSHACGLCDVATSCFARGGPLAAAYDPDFPGNRPGF